MEADLAGGFWRHTSAGNGRIHLKNTEENGGMSLGRIRLLTFQASEPGPVPGKAFDFVCGTRYLTIAALK